MSSRFGWTARGPVLGKTLLDRQDGIISIWASQRDRHPNGIDGYSGRKTRYRWVYHTKSFWLSQSLLPRQHIHMFRSPSFFLHHSFLGQVVPGQPLYCIQGPRHDKPDKRASCLILGLGLQRGIFTSQALNRGTKRPETAEQGGAGGGSG